MKFLLKNSRFFTELEKLEEFLWNSKDNTKKSRTKMWKFPYQIEIYD